MQYTESWVRLMTGRYEAMRKSYRKGKRSAWRRFDRSMRYSTARQIKRFTELVCGHRM